MVIKSGPVDKLVKHTILWQVPKDKGRLQDQFEMVNYFNRRDRIDPIRLEEAVVCWDTYRTKDEMFQDLREHFRKHSNPFVAWYVGVCCEGHSNWFLFMEEYQDMRTLENDLIYKLNHEISTVLSKQSDTDQYVCPECYTVLDGVDNPSDGCPNCGHRLLPGCSGALSVVEQLQDLQKRMHEFEMSDHLEELCCIAYQTAEV